MNAISDVAKNEIPSTLLSNSLILLLESEKNIFIDNKKSSIDTIINIMPFFH